MSALALGYGAVAAAAGGYDVPNIAPITQLHPREMVLPESLAEHVRAMTAQLEGGGGSAGRPLVINFRHDDMGGGFFVSHMDELNLTIKQLVRNGSLRMPS